MPESKPWTTDHRFTQLNYSRTPARKIGLYKDETLKQAMLRLQAIIVCKAISDAGGKVSEAVEKLGCSRATVYDTLYKFFKEDKNTAFYLRKGEKNDRRTRAA